MNQIYLLSEEEILKIAAGEVVQRPANIVKELLENSIDANAKNIVLSIKAGGKKEIFLQDDGHGMDEKNLELSVLPHATSKIQFVDDLAKLKTFGFRGEALASIAAVSEMEIKSRAREALTNSSGFTLMLNFGKKIFKEESTCNFGTSISLKKIFENTPVRKKFMKNDEVEGNQVWQTFINTALPNYQVSFKFLKDDNLICYAPATQNIVERITQIFGQKISKNLIPIFLEKEEIKIWGFTSNLQLNRYNKSFMHLFVNGRPFHDNKIINALCNGYQGALPSGKFPVSFIFFEIDPSNVDVNIHPSKDEILFLEHHKIIRFCKEVVLNALSNQLNNENSEELILDTIKNQEILSDNQKEPDSIFGSNEEVLAWEEQNELSKKNNFFSFAQQPESWTEKTLNIQEKQEERTATKMQEEEKNNDNLKTFMPSSFEIFKPKKILDFSTAERIDFSKQQTSLSTKDEQFIGQIWDTFLILQKKEKLVLIDQHAASERILYEQMKSNFENLPKIKLLFPLVIEFSEADITRLESISFLFCQFGIVYEKFGKQKLIVQTTPPKLDVSEMGKLFNQALKCFDSDLKLEKENIRKNIFEKIHAQIACKSAIKAGTKLSIVEMEHLWKDLLTVANNFQCIHGRPTFFEIKKETIIKWFLR